MDREVQNRNTFGRPKGERFIDKMRQMGVAIERMMTCFGERETQSATDGLWYSTTYISIASTQIDM